MNKIKRNKTKHNKTKHNKIKRNKIKRNKTKNKYCLNGGTIKEIQPLLTNLQQNSAVLPVQLSSINVFVVICKKKNFTELCNYIEDYLREKYITFETLNSRNTIYPYVFFFHGNYYELRNKRKDVFYSISVEYDECFNFELAINTYLTNTYLTISKNLFVLNIFGNIVFHLLLKYSTHDNDLHRYYDELYDKDTNTFKVDELKLIQFLQDTNNIFSECHIYYRSISSNILKNMLQYFNPKISNVIPIKGVENIGNYNDIEQELNALCLEMSFGKDTINLRCIFNMIILIINYTILDNNRLGICTKSGGEVYRYYGDPVTYTNDIDTKIFYSLNSVEKIQKIQEHILELLIRLTYYIKKFEHINNMIKRLNEKYIHFGGLLIKLSFKPFKGDVDTRVRSKLISDIRLFSLDVFIGITFEINKMNARNQETYIDLIYKEHNDEDIETDNKTSAHSECFFRQYNQHLYSFDSYMVTSPLDIANISTITSQQALTENFIKYVDKMPILSKQYLIHDIEYLLTRTEREGKRQKDEHRLQFLKENLDKPIQNIEQLNTCVQYYDKWMKYLLEQTTDTLNINTYVQNQITQFHPTLVEGSTKNYKTPLFVDDKFDNDDKFDLFQ